MVFWFFSLVASAMNVTPYYDDKVRRLGGARTSSLQYLKCKFRFQHLQERRAMAGVERDRFSGDIQRMTSSRTTSERSDGMNQRSANSLNSSLPPGEESNLPFPKLLRQRRRELDVSQKQLAERAGG